MKTFSIIIFLFAVAVSGQDIEHWEFQTADGKPDIQDAGGVVLCFGVRDSFYTHLPPYDWHKLLYMHVLEPDGKSTKHRLHDSGRLYYNVTDGDKCFYDYVSAITQKDDVLVAATYRRYWSYSFGMHFTGAGPLQLFLLRNGELTQIATWEAGAQPALLTARDGTTYLAWEEVSYLKSDTADGRYNSTLQTVSITPELGIGEKESIGTGYAPALVEREDGTVYVLYRTAEHSARTRESMGLHMQRIDSPAGSNIVVTDGQRASERAFRPPSHLVTEGPGNTLHIVWDLDTAFVYYHFDEDNNVSFGGSSIGTGLTFAKDADDYPVFFWRQRDGEEIRWSSATDGRLFGLSQHISHTSEVKSWTAMRGPDGHVKLLYPVGQIRDTLYAIRDVLSPHADPVLVFGLPEVGVGIIKWIMDRDWRLYIQHGRTWGANNIDPGIFALKDVTLGWEESPVFVKDMHIGAVYPQPVRSGSALNIVLHVPEPRRSGRFILFDLLGRERYTQDISVHEGIDHHTLPLPSLEPGLYLLSILTPDACHTSTIMITKQE
ncbi:MAG: T9SS type A sorting domain-containing protein [Bacteroidetes bacterium]|nr:T9SS type A sorting domain-containing protein [Bacteroidota bacterium]